MEKPALSDPAIYPTEEVLASHLGKAEPCFALLFRFNHENFPEFVERWKYYNDGKSWLLNVSRKKKTLFWLLVKDGCFRTTFYLNPKAAQRVHESAIPKELRDKFEETAGHKFRGISVEVKTKKDVEVYKHLLAIKMETM